MANASLEVVDKELINPMTVDPWSLPCVLFSDRRNLPDCPGVYFALKDRRVLYIGKASKSIKNRWYKHGRIADLEKIEGAIIAWIALEKDAETINDIEKQLISFFSPELNICHSSRIVPFNSRRSSSTSEALQAKILELEKENNDLKLKLNKKTEEDEWLIEYRKNANELVIKFEESLREVRRYAELLAGSFERADESLVDLWFTSENLSRGYIKKVFDYFYWQLSGTTEKTFATEFFSDLLKNYSAEAKNNFDRSLGDYTDNLINTVEHDIKSSVLYQEAVKQEMCKDDIFDFLEKIKKSNKVDIYGLDV